LRQGEGGQGRFEGAEEPFVGGGEEAQDAPDLRRSAVVGGNADQAVEMQALAGDDNEGDDVREEAETGEALTGEARALGGEAGARVLEEQPLDPEEGHLRYGAAVDPCAELDQRLARAVALQAHGLTARV